MSDLKEEILSKKFKDGFFTDEEKDYVFEIMESYHQAMKAKEGGCYWVKASELKEIDWPVCIKYDGGGAPYYTTVCSIEELKSHVSEMNPIESIFYLHQSTTPAKEVVKDNVLIEALNKINQCSDTGTPEAAIIYMKKIAREALQSLPVLVGKDEKKFYCQNDIEENPKCDTQCDHCKEYYKPLQSPSTKDKDREVAIAFKEKVLNNLKNFYDYGNDIGYSNSQLSRISSCIQKVKETEI